MDSINELLELSPPVALALVLIGIGVCLKRAPKCPNWLIPICLCVIGATVFPFISDAAKVNFNVRNPQVFNVLIGALIGLASTGIHSQFKSVIDRFLPADDSQKQP